MNIQIYVKSPGFSDVMLESTHHNTLILHPLLLTQVVTPGRFAPCLDAIHSRPLICPLKGRDDSKPPSYPDRIGSTPQELRTERREYWRWFDTNFSATQAMIAVEEASREHGRIQWIDYRVPVTTEGDTLHLHVCPEGKFDTGVFAYNFIKRGYKHGLRLVGTLKSEPDMNVLAIYER